MDGTLLNRDHQISPENQQAIARAKELGIHVVIATGRAYPEVIKLLHPAGIAGIRIPVITLNGAQIYLENGEMLHSIPMNHEQVTKIHQMATKEGVYHVLFSDKGNFPCKQTYPQLVQEFQNGDFQTPIQLNMFEEKLRWIQEKVESGKDIDQALRDSSISYLKCVLFSYQKKKLEKVIQHLQGMDHLAISSSAPQNIEVNHQDAQKGKALKVLAEKLGVPISQTMAIGDNWNDLSMFQVAGLRVAMGNAEQKLMNSCDKVTKTNNENGVAFAFKKWVFEDTKKD